MGFGKFLGGALCAVGAVIAAPVVLPAMGAVAVGAAGAAAAGAAAAGAAVGAVGAAGAAAGAAVGAAGAAAGAAAVGAAGAAGAAAVGAAGAAAATMGAAVTSTAIGGAVVGTAATAAAGIGTGVAGAASAVGLTSVASLAGTTAGATALGTITTAGTVGVVSGISGAKKLAEAKDMVDAAQYRVGMKRKELEDAEDKANSALEKLGKEKLKLWGSFDRFIEMYSKIQNPPVMDGSVDKESLQLSKEELKNVKAVAFSAKELLSGGMGSVGAGGFIGMATSGGLVSSISVASTGTAISSLSGAAATNATMAALGGGSLAAGGAGMAGGAAVLGGLTFAPMLMVGGIMLNGKAKKSLESAGEVEKESDKVIRNMEEAVSQLKKVQKLGNEIRIELGKLNKRYAAFMDEMEEITGRKIKYSDFSDAEKRKLEKTILVLKLIKQLSMQNILDGEHENAVLEEEAKGTLRRVARMREENLAA